MGVRLCVDVYTQEQSPWGLGEFIASPGAGVTISCVSPDIDARNQTCLEEQYALLATEPSLWPWPPTFNLQLTSCSTPGFLPPPARSLLTHCSRGTMPEPQLIGLLITCALVCHPPTSWGIPYCLSMRVAKCFMCIIEVSQPAKKKKMHQTDSWPPCMPGEPPSTTHPVLAGAPVSHVPPQLCLLAKQISFSFIMPPQGNSR